MNKPKFVIGIGSQRAGSTLLHRILDECTDIFMHPVKELHYFDTLYNVRHQDVLTQYSQRQLDRELDRLIKEKDHSYISSKKYKCFLRANKILASKKIEKVDYLDLYRPCLMGNPTVGEITPEYMILPEEGVKHMADMLGKKTPIILITRDPVERFVSAFKLLKAYGKENVDMNGFEEEILNVFETMPTWVEQQKNLSDYKKAEEKYRKFFDKILIISYEELTSNPDIGHSILTDFLNVDVDKEKYISILGKRVNQIESIKELSESAMNKLQGELCHED